MRILKTWFNHLTIIRELLQAAVIVSLRPRPQVSGYFSIRNSFFPDSKISTSTRIRIQNEFARPHVSGFSLVPCLVAY